MIGKSRVFPLFDTCSSMNRYFTKFVAWLGPRLRRLQEHYSLVAAVNQIIFEYNARVREARIELAHANLDQVFDRDCKDFVGTWAGLFRLSKEDLLHQLQSAKQDLEDYNNAFSKMGEARRAIALSLREQKMHYLRSVKEAEKAYKKLADH